jgi:hypothetical protein
MVGCGMPLGVYRLLRHTLRISAGRSSFAALPQRKNDPPITFRSLAEVAVGGYRSRCGSCYHHGVSTAPHSPKLAPVDFVPYDTYGSGNRRLLPRFTLPEPLRLQGLLTLLAAFSFRSLWTLFQIQAPLGFSPSEFCSPTSSRISPKTLAALLSLIRD